MKKIFIKLIVSLGEYEHSDNYIFDKKMSEYGYCKSFGV